MKLLKRIAVTVVMTASMLAVSSTTFAATEHKDLNAVVESAAKNTEAKLLEVKSLLEKGGDSAQILQAMNDARQFQKEFRYEKTDRLRQKMNDKLKTARDAFEKNDNAAALTNVDAALVLYTEMKKIYDENHK